MVYAKVVYMDWMERNFRVFENKTRQSDAVAKEIAYICNVRATPGIWNL